MEGGLAMADILLGKENPSGKLPDTFAASLDDYPSTANFHDSPAYVEYREDIYVGYRYFETIEQAKETVNYPFGFGLSYTEFSIDVIWAGLRDDRIVITVQVENTGKVPGKEVVQVYCGAPQGKLGKPFRVLAAFEKTKNLIPGEAQMMTLSFPVAALASYDDLGKIKKSAYVLEKGSYCFYVGNSVRDAKKIPFELDVMKDEVTEQLSQELAPRQLPKRMVSDGSYEELEQGAPYDFMEKRK